MTADVQRELAEALPCAANCTGPDDSWCRATRRAQASTLLPTVQALIADAEKRAAARALRDMAVTFDADAKHLGIETYAQAAEDCRDHAAALDPS